MFNKILLYGIGVEKYVSVKDIVFSFFHCLSIKL